MRGTSGAGPTEARVSAERLWQGVTWPACCSQPSMPPSHQHCAAVCTHARMQGPWRSHSMEALLQSTAAHAPRRPWQTQCRPPCPRAALRPPPAGAAAGTAGAAAAAGSMVLRCLKLLQRLAGAEPWPCRRPLWQSHPRRASPPCPCLHANSMIRGNKGPIIALIIACSSLPSSPSSSTPSSSLAPPASP